MNTSQKQQNLVYREKSRTSNKMVSQHGKSHHRRQPQDQNVHNDQQIQQRRCNAQAQANERPGDNERELVSWSSTAKIQDAIQNGGKNDRALPHGKVQAGCQNVEALDSMKMRRGDAEESISKRKALEKSSGIGKANATIQKPLSMQSQQLQQTMKQTQEQIFSGQQQILDIFKLQKPNKVDGQKYELESDENQVNPPFSSSYNIENNQKTKYKIQNSYELSDVQKQLLNLQNNAIQPQPANYDRPQSKIQSNQLNSYINNQNGSLQYDPKRVNSKFTQGNQIGISTRPLEDCLEADDLSEETPGLREADQKPIQPQSQDSQKQKRNQGYEDEHHLKCIGPQILKAQASTAQPKKTGKGRFSKEKGKIISKRERNGRSHAPGMNANEPDKNVGVAGSRDQAHHFDNQQVGNLSSEKTSATGSNGSQDSPQYLHIKKPQDSASLFFGPDSPELIPQMNNSSMTQKKQQKQPLYKQIVLSSSTSGHQFKTNNNYLESTCQLPGEDMMTDQFQEAEIELNEEQEEKWDSQMSQIVNQMRNQLELDLKGLHSTQEYQKTSFDMDFGKFVDSKSFDLVLSTETSKSQKSLGIPKAKRFAQKNQSGKVQLTSLNNILFGNNSDDQEIFNFEKQARENELLMKLHPTIDKKERSQKIFPKIVLDDQSNHNETVKDQSDSKSAMTKQDLSDFISQVQHESDHKSNQGINSAVEEDTEQSYRIPKKEPSKIKQRIGQQKFFEHAACFQVPSLQEVPEDFFE